MLTKQDLIETHRRMADPTPSKSTAGMADLVELLDREARSGASLIQLEEIVSLGLKWLTSGGDYRIRQEDLIRLAAMQAKRGAA